ncbi:ubiquinone/menaquinone biosynthesis C-methylase UbiE [Nocardioides sp. BE266]|uniref:class I SAM-dependent methyltransferase n=1 Tax=Nocardioides sp. BE266 TaxID=2817725 RepID=UPI00285D6BC5|nr:class I SAM-dependent methyltransferase [Nocardioides sp. BE266]MDR7255256.1 ubiquinone/menaquinone biosynthesis C-methylase UbiE [Nocardioides sp. BE266]
MTTVEENIDENATPAIDMDQLMEFVGKFVGDLGATVGAGNVMLGERLGLYRALATGPADARELATRTGTDPRYVDEWLRGQAAGGYVQYDAGSATYSMTPEQAFALTDPSGPVFLPGAFELALGALKAGPEIEQAFRTGAGYGWHQHDEDVFTGCERFFRPGYLMHLLTEWIPALEGVQAKLERGARVADLGCGHGASTLLMADAFPASGFVGSDYHQGSIESARERAAAAGLGDRVRFDVAGAQTLDERDLDLVTTFDCLHDMGDPLGAAQHVRRSLAPDGTWMIVEPAAGDTVADNLNPVGRVFYGFSTFLCVPNAVSQPGGYALGAQAGQAAIRQVVTDAGFTRFRKVAETPFNHVYEARP